MPATKALPPLKEKANASAGSKRGSSGRKNKQKSPKQSPKVKAEGQNSVAAAAAGGGSGGGSGKRKETSNRRHRHNESERLRMRTIAAKIAEMKELMEATGIVVPKEKAKILTGAVEYIKHLKNVAATKTVQLSRVQDEESFFNASPLPSCVMDAACNYIDSNRHFTRYFG